jgi:uroporphyrinogen-III decarboxylase
MTSKEKLTSNYLMAKRNTYLPIWLMKSAGKSAKELELVQDDLTDLGAALTLLYDDAELFGIVVEEVKSNQ